MSGTDTTEETVTASQRRHMFEELFGATRDKDKRLWWALDQVIVAAQDERDDQNNQEVAELARHFPALESVMLLVWAHIQRTNPAAPCDACEPAPARS